MRLEEEKRRGSLVPGRANGGKPARRSERRLYGGKRERRGARWYGCVISIEEFIDGQGDRVTMSLMSGKKPVSQNEVISTTEAAKRLGVNPRTIRRWYDAGMLPNSYPLSTIPRSRLKVAVEDVENLLAQRKRK